MKGVPENEFGEKLYASGQAPQVGDIVEFGSQHERLLVCRVYQDSFLCGAERFPPHLAVLISRATEQKRETQP